MPPQPASTGLTERQPLGRSEFDSSHPACPAIGFGPQDASGGAWKQLEMAAAYLSGRLLGCQ